MKLRHITTAMLALGLVSGCVNTQTSHEGQAKLTESQARAIALEKVPNGTIKEGELEHENGKLQWSFDIATPGSRDITEVNIDAITGKNSRHFKRIAQRSSQGKRRGEKGKERQGLTD